MSKKVKKVIIIEKIKNYKTEENKKDLLQSKGYKNIKDAKETLSMKSEKQVYEYLMNEYNKNLKEDVNVFRVKKRSDVFKKKQNKKVFIIQAVVKQTWKKNGKVREYNVNVDEIFETNSINVAREIDEFANNTFNYESTTDGEPEKNLVSYTFQQIDNNKYPKTELLDVKMKRAKPVKMSFLKYFDCIDNLSYADHNDECVFRMLMKHFDIKKRSTFMKLCDKISQKEYEEPFDITKGISSRMIYEISKYYNVNLLGLDQKNNQFVKYIRKENGSHKHKSIIFIIGCSHFYLIDKNKEKIQGVFKNHNIVSSNIF